MKTIDSLKWVFTTTVLRRLLSFLLFIYIVRVFSRAELGVYREFALILSLASLVSMFSFNIFIVVERSKSYFKHGLQFILFSSIIISIVLLSIRSFLAEQYQHHDLYLYILYGFWLVIPETLKRLVKSMHELDRNFKLLSIAETVNVVFYCILCLILFAIDLKFYYFIIAFYLGNIVELIIISCPIRKELLKTILECLKLKYIMPLKTVFKGNLSFLGLSTTPAVLNTFIADAPILILGLFFLPSYIGNYFIAAQLVTVPISLITYSLMQVLFPAFSLTVREQLPQKVNDYIRHVIFVMWIPMLVFGILLKYFSYLIVGIQDIILIYSIVVVLTLRSLFALIVNPISTIPNVLKKPQYELYWSIGSIACICLAMYLFRNATFMNVIYLFTGLSIVSLIFYIIMIYKLIGMPLINMWRLLGKGIVYCMPLMLFLVFSDNTDVLFGMVWLVLIATISVYGIYKMEMGFFRALLIRVFNK